MEALLNTRQVAEILGVSYRTVRRWYQEGTLKPARLSSDMVRFRPEDIEAFVDSRVEHGSDSEG